MRLFIIINFLIIFMSFQGEGIVIVDAGGGTIDVSTYKRVSQEKKRVFEEIAMAECPFSVTKLEVCNTILTF